MRLRVHALLFLALSLSAPGVCLSQQEPAGLKVKLELKDMDGRTQNLTRYQGHLVVLNFWAPWCEYCREKIPFLDTLSSHYPKGRLQVIGARVDDPQFRGQVHRYKQPLTIHFPLWVGATVKDMNRFGFGDALPATVIIDTDGQIVSRIVGAFDNSDLTRQIEWLLSDRTGPSPLNLALETKMHDHDAPVAIDSQNSTSDLRKLSSTEDVRSDSNFAGSSVVPSCALCPSPTVSGAIRKEENRWSTSLRIVPGLTHSSVRMTLGYQVHPRLSGGLAFYPVHSTDTSLRGTGSSSGHSHGAVQPTDNTAQSTDLNSGHTPVRPFLNFVAVSETRGRPAVILGTSSDRIDLPYGQAYFATIGKSLFRETHLPIAPYVGASYGTYDHRLRPIGGLNTNITKHISSLVIFDGVNVHPVISVRLGPISFSFMMIRCKLPGGSIGSTL